MSKDGGEGQSWADARQRWPRRTAKAERVWEGLGRYLDWVRSKVDLKLAVLFGSHADGSFRMDSDVDLLVVAEGIPRGWGERRVLLEEYGSPARLQTFPYTPQEFIEMCRRNNGIAFSALTEGQVLYIDDEYRGQLLEAI